MTMLKEVKIINDTYNVNEDGSNRNCISEYSTNILIYVIAQIGLDLKGQR